MIRLMFDKVCFFCNKFKICLFIFINVEFFQFNILIFVECGICLRFSWIFLESGQYGYVEFYFIISFVYFEICDDMKFLGIVFEIFQFRFDVVFDLIYCFFIVFEIFFKLFIDCIFVGMFKWWVVDVMC